MENKDLPFEREVFRRHYEEDTSQWGKQSGGGSNPYFTVEYRAFIDKFIRMNNIKSVVDVGCGDWQFSRFLNFDGVSYLGLDVVPGVIERNDRVYGSKNVHFRTAPENIGDIEKADLLIMKDVLQHLPNSVIFSYAQVVFPGFKHCLLTNSFAKLNTSRNNDIAHGEFRSLDLSAPPFSFDGSYVLEFPSAHWERIRTFLYRSTR
jgi:2-polyprenyl-3-methyl-5-hydroxy-6-metoxy-1,4-benzoquinol methylase